MSFTAGLAAGYWLPRNGRQSGIGTSSVATAVAWRIMLRRVMGKASFITQQTFLGKSNVVGEKQFDDDVYEGFTALGNGGYRGCARRIDAHE